MYGATVGSTQYNSHAYLGCVQCNIKIESTMSSQPKFPGKPDIAALSSGYCKRHCGFAETPQVSHSMKSGVCRFTTIGSAHR
jgi:hypothetical protein